MLEQLKAEDFSRSLHSKFKIYLTDETAVEAELVEVYELPTKENLQSFSIIFQFPPDSPREQRIFRVEHPEMPAIELFLVPVGQNEQGIRFEAIFNRIIEQ